MNLKNHFFISSFLGIFIFAVFLSLPIFKVNAQVNPQQQPGDKAAAKDNYLYGDWKAAMLEYETLLKKDSTNATYNYRAGICYLQTYTNRKKAIEHLEKAIKYKVSEKDAPFMLAKAYHLDMQFDMAIEKYKVALKTTVDPNLINRAKLYVQMCENGKKMVANPLKNIKIENLGPDINSPEPDYYPFIDEVQSTLFFSTKRSKGNSGYLAWDGLYSSDIFISNEKDGKWGKPRTIGGAVGTPQDEEIVGLTPDASHLIINFFDFIIKDDIMVSEKQGKQYKKPELFSLLIDNPATKETSGCFLPDKKTLYFSSTRAGGKGGIDIWMSKKLPTGDWSDPINLDYLNTEWDDAFPHVSSDGNTMFFASEGYESMGGYDIYKCQWDTATKKWINIKNMGYPINSVFNDYNISMDITGRTGYISTFRKENSVGDLDIFEVTFLNVEPRISSVIGKLYYSVPIDYNDYQEFITYEKNGVKKRFVPTYLPDTLQWKFIKKEKEMLKPGTEYKSFVTVKKGETTKVFSTEKIPTDIKGYEFVNIDHKLSPIKNYQPKSSSLPKETRIFFSEAFIKVFEKESNKKVGEYRPNPANNRFLMALSEGNYILKIEADGFKPEELSLSVLGKSSYKFQFEKDFPLTPIKAPESINYTEIPK